MLRSMNRRRVMLVGLVGGVGGIAVLLIVLWVAGVFDSAPPPVTLQSAVESVREDTAEPEQPEGETQVQPAETAQQADQPEQSAQTPSQRVEEQSTQDQPSRQSEQMEQAQPQAQVQQQHDSADSDQAATDEQPETTQQAQPTVAPLPALDELTGSWTLSAQGSSFVGYRIGEELAQIGTTTAVGRTSDIVASLEFDGTAISVVEIQADMRTLRSDQSFRDSALRDRGLESDTYPFATFVLTEPIPIDALPIDEESLAVTVQGTLDLHGVTNPVSIDLQGQFVDGLVVVIGSTEIALADYAIEKPTGFRVLSIEDVGVMEFQLVFEPAP